METLHPEWHRNNNSALKNNNTKGVKKEYDKEQKDNDEGDESFCGSHRTI